MAGITCSGNTSTRRRLHAIIDGHPDTTRHGAHAGGCRDCGRPFTHRPGPVPGHVHDRRDGQCGWCRLHQPPPAHAVDTQDRPVCRDCKAPLAPRGTVPRAGWRRHGGHGYCTTHYNQRYEDGSLTA